MKLVKIDTGYIDIDRVVNVLPVEAYADFYDTDVDKLIEKGYKSVISIAGEFGLINAASKKTPEEVAEILNNSVN